MKRLKVRSRRNSQCNYNVEDDSLDWSNWWTDHLGGEWPVYLHVEASDKETVQRVYCRRSDQPRIAMQNGELYWLIDEEKR